MSFSPVLKTHRTPKKCLLWLSLLGPGFVVMLADTDAGSLITAAQSGAVWGYRLLALQFLLMPILYIAQELTVRLGITTGMGHGELIKHYFGKVWAWLSVTTLVVSCIGAILSEFSGLAGVGALFNIPAWETLSLVVTFLTIVAWTGSYRSVERVAILLGLFELIFLWVAWDARPVGREILSGLIHIPWQNKSYLYLLAGNIGAVIMPWMIFYQQSAVLDKGLNASHLRIARWDTAIGAIITQLIMASLLIATAATIGKINPEASLNTVQQISQAITPSLGCTVGRVLFALGMTGAALVASIVVSLTAAWGLGEVMGFRRSLEHRPKDAPWFYGIYTLILVLGGLLVASGRVNLVHLSVGVEVMNALLLPFVLGFLYLLALRALPKEVSLKPLYAILVGIILLVTSSFGLFGGLSGIL
ncbi:NRAMP family divalent metal transporter [Rickettsiella grylli]|uniref:Metal ion transporter, nramp family n=1 Tax=Rickettsiella grylli TaxID=59196 RepID=A8PNI7_9COXI|nr:divalent metal cation transporter [Rickettsiella grylli]EDP47001.1 metal ion transporter, nramp family [Rickettsiella grylli]